VAEQEEEETKGPKWFYSEAVFTKDCFEVAVEKMFVDVPSLLINLPCDADIGQEIERGYLCADITCATRTVNDIMKRTKTQKKVNAQCASLSMEPHTCTRRVRS